jgi:hypothetical protein
MALRDARGLPPAGDEASPGSRQAQPPSHRPGWLVMLSSLTLVYGGLLLVSSLTALRDPQGAARIPVTQPLTPPQEALAKQLAEINTRVVLAHVGAIRASAAGSLVLALLMLYTAASTLSRDRHGRTVALTAAWVGIVYQLGSLFIAIPIARDYARLGAALLAQLVTLQQGAAGDVATPESVSKLLLGVPVLMTVAGMLSSLVLLRFFGGRRGRVLYGLEPARGKG